MQNKVKKKPSKAWLKSNFSSKQNNADLMSLTWRNNVRRLPYYLPRNSTKRHQIEEDLKQYQQILKNKKPSRRSDFLSVGGRSLDMIDKGKHSPSHNKLMTTLRNDLQALEPKIIEEMAENASLKCKTGRNSLIGQNKICLDETQGSYIYKAKAICPDPPSFNNNLKRKYTKVIEKPKMPTPLSGLAFSKASLQFLDEKPVPTLKQLNNHEFPKRKVRNPRMHFGNPLKIHHRYSKNRRHLSEQRDPSHSIQTQDLAAELSKFIEKKPSLPVFVNKARKNDSGILKIFKNSSISKVKHNKFPKMPSEEIQKISKSKPPSSLMCNLRRIDDRVIDYKKSHGFLLKMTSSYMEAQTPVNQKKVKPDVFLV
ncbi:unnamed protein product [Moneuplotes crassus]|uniref:Uncharacterized protein n=1 Tax=Euplotes crassus TaxID=5936 RepID=A0AAD1UJZ4_EUPCR|nr:unnamed protein product [Moneuplotes crassus]